MSVPVWGVPWHGRVEGGQLLLPNATTKTWPQPAGVDFTVLGRTLQYHEHAGYTHLQKMPGVPPVVRSAEALAADQAAGRTWLDAALIAGQLGAARLHSQSVPGWIYAAPDGSRWIVTGAWGHVQLSPTAGLSYLLGVSRFGVFGQGGEGYSQTLGISVADMGQQTWTSSGSSYERRYAKVESIRPDGAAAIIGLHSVSVKETFSGRSVAKKNLALGFLLLSLSGTPGVDFTATLTVLRSAAQTAGTVDRVPAEASTAYTSLQVTGQVVTDHTSNDPPACGGYLEGTETVSRVEGSAGSSVSSYTVASSTTVLSLSGRIIGMWFTEAGDIEEVTLDCTHVTQWNLPPPTMAYSAQNIYRTGDSPAGGGASCTLAGTTDWIWDELSTPVSSSATESNSRSSSYTTEVTFKVRAGAQQITLQASTTESLDDSYSRSLVDGALVSAGGARIQTKTEQAFGWSTSTTVQASYSGNQPGRGADGIGFGLVGLDQFDALATGHGEWRNSAGTVRIAKWSNGAFGLVASDRSGAIRWSDAVTPAGVAPGDLQATSLAAGSTWYTQRPYGAFNPLSGEAVIASATPISFT